MLGNYVIISDGSCDLPEELAKEKDIEVIPFYVAMDGDHYGKEGIDVGVREFYQHMVDHPDIFPRSSMPSIEDYYNAFKAHAQASQPVICICITTKFSGSATAAENARGLVLEEYPDAKITVIDSQINTVLQGLYVQEAAKLRDAGISYEESVKILLDIRSSGRIFFTVGSVDYLRSGGRIGKVARVVGGIMKIRPIITLKEGEIFGSGISRSRRKSIDKCVDLLRQYVKEFHVTKEEYVFDIGFGYDYEEAVKYQETLIIMLKEEGIDLEKEDIKIYQIGSGIGVHTGPYPLGVAVLKRAIKQRS